MTATIRVFTFKDGLLARLAHDLRLTLRRFEVRREGANITGTFWPGSLVVDGAVKGGELDASAFSAGDRAKIADNLAEVLHVGRHPEVTLVAEVDAARRIRGQLTLAGCTRPIEAVARADGGKLTAEVVLTPSLWGIPPYRALAGAIKLQDRVVVRAELPLADGGEPADPAVWSAG